MAFPLRSPGEHPNEWLGRCIRWAAGVDPDKPLDPWRLAEKLGFNVITPCEVPGLKPEHLYQLLVEGQWEWSGAASTGDLKVIVLNPVHSKQRQTATLVEELVHLLCGHRPTNVTSLAGLTWRDYDKATEQQAFQAAAAALVPREPLTRMVREGMTAEQIAHHYRVSPDLVKMRIKLCRLWREYDAIQRGKPQSPA